MKISTKGRYALAIMLDLAMNNPEEYISLKDIATRQEVSIKYLERIIAILNKAGYVKSSSPCQKAYVKQLSCLWHPS